MNTINRVAINSLTEHETTTNLTIVTYISIVGMSELNKETGYPTITNYTTYNLAKYMKDKMYWISESSVRLAIIRLFDQGFIGYMDEEKTELAVFNFGCGHIKSDENFKSEGYIKLHHFFFSKAFFDLSLPTKKLALILSSRFDGDAIEPRRLNFKSKKDPEMFPYWCKTLKVNRLAHIGYAVDELKVFFHVTRLENNTVKFYLNTLSKALVTGTDKLFKYTQAQLEQTERMMKEESKEGVSFKHKDVQEICEATCGYSMVVRRRTIKELCKHSRKHVKNFIGYTQSVMKRLSEEIAERHQPGQYQNC